MSRRSADSTVATTGELGRVLLGAPAARSELSRIATKTLLERTRDELALAARLLGLKGLSRLRKSELAQHVRKALRTPPLSGDGGLQAGAVAKPSGRSRPTRARAGGARQDGGGARRREVPGRRARVRRGGVEAGETGARSKFDLGSRQKEPAREHIPWDYNQSRVTAMVVDPKRMYAFWEVRDDAIESARAALGPGGEGAWLNLRVYDITGRIFDGTNAHSYFDTQVERRDRQWFFTIGKPTSTQCVELGMKSLEGYFQKIARSALVDFPRAEPAEPGPIEWLSVHAITGEVGAPEPGAPHPQAEAPAGASPAPAPAGQQRPGALDEGEYWVVNDFGSLAECAILSGWESHDSLRSEWIGGHGSFEWTGGRQRFEWVGPVVRTSWEAGPFPIPVEAPGLVEERHEGPVLVHKLGDKTHIIYGPWQVVIRGIGARAEGRVLATWEVRKSWVTQVGCEVIDGKLRWEALGAPDVVLGPPGASERLQPGASERRWLAGSEVRLAGASEVFGVGASEFRYLGASETLFAGASEQLYAGASERHLGEASESRYPGASEKAGRKGVYPKPSMASRKS